MMSPMRAFCFLVAVSMGIFGLGVYFFSPMIVIGPATQAWSYSTIFICGGICTTFTLAGVVS